MSFIYTFKFYIIYFLWDLKYLKHLLNIISENGFVGSTGISSWNTKIDEDSLMENLLE